MKSYLCCLYTLECVVFHWSILNLPLQKTDPTSPSFYQLPVSPYPGVGLMPRPVSTLGSCAHCHQHHVFLHATALLWLGNSAPCLHSPPLALNSFLSSERGGMIQVSCLRLNIPLSLIVCIPIICKVQ